MLYETRPGGGLYDNPQIAKINQTKTRGKGGKRGPRGAMADQSGNYMDFADESVLFPMEKLFNTFVLGHVKGETITDISFGPIIHHLFSACEIFKDIFILRVKETCVMELNNWLHDQTGAYDWSHTAQIIKQLEGESVQYKEKEMKLKTAIKHIVKCDIEKENLTDPLVLPQADCLITAWLLESLSKDKEDYIKNLRRFLTFLKPKGQLILFGTLNATYYTVGEEKFHSFKTNESFIRETLTGEGLIIDQCEILPRKAKSDLSDYDSIVFITAHRGQQI
ncbi:nicotinamide N-methyltransferase-like [Rhinoderma darwinii]|uniref:nicotinamide N-methyltransferase-like n=1 Tax=Rhinoderma darwinii TaxID=43563 RepID=UPI003F6809B4